ncbi:hypothetical protein [Kitasatospora kifunensis]|uniref:Uncharacterized protein n=1 Tax=Kitasatospora kifunensis TaxID=58351 RepID=A0A7W7R0Z5_KITKI|nr:hypothetical protein [Kitasatospora kifunensis]MBB4923451.1 hypothetical protein [Kitasatospora kifunensis]
MARTFEESVAEILPCTPETDADSLFAFAQVSLLYTATALQGMGAKLEIVSIGREPAD